MIDSTKAPTLISDRLLLRAVGPTDQQVLYDRVFSDPEVMAQAFDGRVFSPTEAAEFVRLRFDHDGDGLRPGVLVEKQSKDIMGFAGLMPCEALGEQDFEIGFVLARTFWGKGYGSEIGRAQLDFGFNHTDRPRLLALADPKNVRSVAVLTKLGMHRLTAVNDDRRGRRDIYQILRTDWQT